MVCGIKLLPIRDKVISKQHVIRKMWKIKDLNDENAEMEHKICPQYLHIFALL